MSGTVSSSQSDEPFLRSGGHEPPVAREVDPVDGSVQPDLGVGRTDGHFLRAARTESPLASIKRRIADSLRAEVGIVSSDHDTDAGRAVDRSERVCG